MDGKWLSQLKKMKVQSISDRHPKQHKVNIIYQQIIWQNYSVLFFNPEFIPKKGKLFGPFRLKCQFISF